MKSKKEQILDVSFSLFLEKGYDQTSISDILSYSNMARGTLYYHFESKEAIMDAIIERTTQKLIEEAKSIALQTDLSVYDKLFALFYSTSVKRLTGGDLMIDYLNQPQNALFHEKTNRASIEKIAPILGDIIKEGVTTGVFDTAFPYESAEMMLVMVMGYMDNDYQQTADVERRMESFLYVMERMLGAEKGSFAIFQPLSVDEK